MRPSDEQVEAWCKTPDMDWSELKAELLRARAGEAEKEAKLREAEEARSLAGDRGRSLANCNGRPFALSEIVANLCHDFANAKAAKEDALEAYERVRLRAETAERERDEARALLRRAVPEDDGWWCPSCREALPGGLVTYDERCVRCGTGLCEISTPQWVADVRAALGEKP